MKELLKEILQGILRAGIDEPDYERGYTAMGNKIVEYLDYLSKEEIIETAEEIVNNDYSGCHVSENANLLTPSEKRDINLLFKILGIPQLIR